ncbi:DUF4097 family beta strand repeat-containing protein [Nocardia sp. NPDC051570]|uniref:DUF4097 family beta strand repeat-containing protein n=1 Tax=Nocardia sp. NPDC051570 TaxID=3364324 RepID=UPI0037ACE29B
MDSASGGVTITGRAGVSQVSLQRSLAYRGAAPSGVTYHVDNGELVLNGCGQDCSVDYTLTVPANLPVSGSIHSGAITLSGMGSVDVSTDSGQVSMDTIAGPVKVETASGKIQGQGIKGDHIQAKTSNGGIDLTLATAQDVRAETHNGAIDLAVPASSYHVTAETHSGDKNVDVPNTPTGQYHLDLRTSNGHIAVKSA